MRKYLEPKQWYEKCTWLIEMVKYSHLQSLYPIKVQSEQVFRLLFNDISISILMLCACTWVLHFLLFLFWPSSLLAHAHCIIRRCYYLHLCLFYSHHTHFVSSPKNRRKLENSSKSEPNFAPKNNKKKIV